MIRVLQEVATMDIGGVERLLFDYYAHLDRREIAFDFVISFSLFTAIKRTKI